MDSSSARRAALGKLNAIDSEVTTSRPANATDNSTENSIEWWGQNRFALDQVRRWRLGPSRLWVERREFEWRLHQLEQAENNDIVIEAGELTDSGEIDSKANLDRYATSSNGMLFTVTPQLADRPLVVRPETPLFVPSGEDVTLYVSTPLWMRLEAGPPNRLLSDRPTQRPSDTWFGPSTLVGELCYASRTSGRLRLAELPQRPHRAITPVRIRNNAKDVLGLERVKVPVQYLALYRSAAGGLWTQTATLIREQDGDFAALQLGRRAPSEAAGAERVTPPRQQAEGHLALRAFSRLFGSA